VGNIYIENDGLLGTYFNMTVDPQNGIQSGTSIYGLHYGLFCKGSHHLKFQ
jgi:hypothetical protein